MFRFKDYSFMSGKHSFLSPSNNTWLNYTADEMLQRYDNSMRVQLGTEIHEFAHECILRKEILSEKVPEIVKMVRAYIYGKYHESKSITLSERLARGLDIMPDEVFLTLSAYVDDAISMEMESEQMLYFSDKCFGTADTIKFIERKNLLIIHDLKTGSVPAKMEQLMIYAALFCLEYKFDPKDLNIELDIYQNNEIAVLEPTVSDIVPIMDKIIEFNNLLKDL